MSAWRVDRSRFWAVVLSSTRISEVCQEKAGHTELDFLLLGIRRPLLLVFFYWYWTEDASRYFRESISVRCGCHPYKWRLHARETPGFDREQKGRLNLYGCLIVWYFYEKLSKLRSPTSSKSSKPIMEKRRRARINESLGQLKTLILDALKKDVRRRTG